MPNWCECDLRIEGPLAKVNDFLAFAKGENGCFDFNRFKPYPEEFARLDRLAEEWGKQPPETRVERPKDGFNSGGYEWCILNWGVKWNAHNPSQSLDSTYTGASGGECAEIEINFETAWSPPKPVIDRASGLFPELRFDLRYFECGCGFNGMFVCEGGEVVTDEDGDYFGSRGG
jgi:hypothetical protein